MDSTFDFTNIFQAIADAIKSKTEGMSAQSIEQIYGYSIEQINRVIISINTYGFDKKKENLLKLYLKNLEDIKVENPNNCDLIRIVPETFPIKRIRTFNE
jgi:hypothetical protein